MIPVVYAMKRKKLLLVVCSFYIADLLRKLSFKFVDFAFQQINREIIYFRRYIFANDFYTCYMQRQNKTNVTYVTT